MSDHLARASANLRATASLLNTSNASEPGYWREIARAAEAIAGISSSANAFESGYMLRAAAAFEVISHTSGAEENRNYAGMLKRVVDALEVETGVVSGSLEYRLEKATETYTGGGGGIVPLVSLDFKNGSYKVSGVSKTLSEVLDWPYSFGTALNPADIIAGQGLKIIADPANTASYFHIIQSDLLLTGFVSLAVWSQNTPAPTGNVQLTSLYQVIDEPGETTAWASQIQVGWDASGTLSATLPQVYDYGTVAVTSPAGLQTQYRQAVRLAPDALSISVNGEPVLSSGTPQPDTAFNSVWGALTAFCDAGQVSSLTLEKIEFFSLSDYAAADLPTLSA